MSHTAIKVENLSKRYRIGYEKQARDTFAEVISDWVSRPIKNYRRLRNLTQFDQSNEEAEDIIWALKDVSFEIKPGQIICFLKKPHCGSKDIFRP